MEIEILTPFRVGGSGHVFLGRGPKISSYPEAACTKLDLFLFRPFPVALCELRTASEGLIIQGIDSAGHR